MAKKMTTQAEETPVKAKKPKEGNLSEPKSGGISIQKYLQLYGSEIHMYSRAYLGEQFRGIMKSKSEWKEEINKIMEGNK